ncbi:MAG: AsmA family protein, partial [Candidatus Binatia bacterium]
MKKTVRRLSFSILAGIAALLMVLVVWALLYTRSEEFRSLMREKSLAAVRSSVNGEFTFGSLSGSVWRGIHFHDVSLVQEGVEVISAPRVTVSVSLIRQAFAFLFSSNIHVARIEIERPALRLAQSGDGKWNIASLLKEPEEPGKKREMTIRLDRLKIEQGSVEAMLSDGRRIHFRALVFDGSLTLPPDGMMVDLADLRFSLSAENYPETAWSGSLAYEMAVKTSRVEVRRLDLRLGGSHLRLTGKIEDLAAPKSTLSVEAKKIAPSDLRKLVPALPLRQDVAGNFKAEGPLSALNIAGTLAAADGVLVGSALVDLSGDAPRYGGTLEIRNLIAERVFRLPDLGGALSAKATFQGAGSEILEASARGSIGGLHVQGWQIGNLALSAALAEKNLHLNAVAQGQGGKAELKTTLLVGERPAYEVSLNARGLDLRKAGAKGPPLALPAQLNLDLWLKGRGTDLKRAYAEAKLTVYPSRIGSIRIARGSAAATLRDGGLDLREARLVSNDASFQAQGRLGNLDQ